MRSTFDRSAVTYGAVGATQATDLFTFPPRGYRPAEYRARIGHGDARWAHAVDGLLDGGVYRGAGMTVRYHPAPAPVVDGTYSPVTFDGDGEPTAPAELASAEQVFSADGRPLLRPADEITVGLGVAGRLLFPLPTRVVLLERADDRVTLAMGTLPGHVLKGEEAFTLERASDGSVWMTVRSFARPAHWWLWPAWPGMLVARRLIAARFLRALALPIPTRGATE